MLVGRGRHLGKKLGIPVALPKITNAIYYAGDVAGVEFEQVHAVVGRAMLHKRMPHANDVIRLHLPSFQDVRCFLA